MCANYHWQTFGLSEQADVYATDIQLNDEGHPTFSLHIDGQAEAVTLQLSSHNVLNALSASAAAYH